MISIIPIVGIFCLHLFSYETSLSCPSAISPSVITAGSAKPKEYRLGQKATEYEDSTNTKRVLDSPSTNKLPNPSHSDWQEEEDFVQPTEDPTSNKPSAVREQSKTMHSDSLPPLSDRLFPHQIFELRYLPQLKPHTSWTKIPNWLAGIWHANSQTMLRDYDLRFGETTTKPEAIQHKTTEAYGTIRDDAGAIWHLAQEHSEKEIHTNGRREYRLKTESSMPVVSENQVLIYSRWLLIEVEDATSVITSTKQQEIIEQLKPSSNEKIRALYSVKCFDATGLPETLTLSAVTLHKTKPFKTGRFCQGQDTKILFKQKNSS